MSLVKGVQIERHQFRAIERILLEARIKDVIKGAEITHALPDGGAVVTLRLPKQRLKKLMGVKFK